MKKILITGGNGFIGTNLILELVKDKNNRVLNIDKFSHNSNSYLIKNRFKNLKNLKLDLLNSTKLKKIILQFKPDLVFHLAAETHVDSSLTNPIKHYENNTKATLNLLCILNSALKKKSLKKNFRFLHVGTDEIYGDTNLYSKKAFDENQKLKPNNPYSASKAAAVLMVETWNKNFGFPCIISNSVNNYGKFQFVEKFIPRSILLAINSKNIEVYGKGKNIRTWISVTDHIKALIFLSKKGQVGQTYNISSGYKLKNIEIAKKIVKILKSRHIESKIKFVKDRLNHDRQYSINSDKIKKLGWKQSVNFDFELKETVEWYLNKDNLSNFKNINKHLLRKGLI